MAVALKFFLIAISFISFYIPASTQTLTLSDCINAFERDTSYVKALDLKGYDIVDTASIEASVYSITRKSRTNADNFFLHKVIFSDSSRNLLLYSFTSVEQFEKLKNELDLEGFVVTNSTKDRKLGGQAKIYLNAKNRLSIGLVELRRKSSPSNKVFSLDIMRY